MQIRAKINKYIEKAIEKKQQNWDGFSENINKINKPLATQIKKKRGLK